LAEMANGLEQMKKIYRARLKCVGVDWVGADEEDL